MDDSEKFNEVSLAEKDDFYLHCGRCYWCRLRTQKEFVKILKEKN